ncbi:TAXI family TRAP transporter solute-binding subunit [Pontivivens nitratireducens]|uniref:TAXI family TRAP transporter solute-binding subunit n=1 Tax=Pontivivens nitratireducens TaxID=2758038 RepID=A0A6G7VM78_9RHOB|nr:TAXI family TRAP transporter solute-binding subunit [Pontibrevibacter nitratireducens]QIK40976.1 TAXI family TRAP transporter solute-binding subunit [Pontibrevibacter nitratireducens]
MMRHSMKLFLAATTAATFAFGTAQAEEADYILATASTGGTYYPVGVALSTLVKVKLQPGQGIGMSAISSAGSGENVRLLREDEAQFAIMQGLYGYYAATGTGPLEEVGPQSNMRAVSMLWQNVEHFVVDSDIAETGTISDLVNATGSSVALGARNSGTIGSNAAILGGLGVDIYENYDLVEGGYGPSAEALQNGQVVGISTPAGVPVGAISQLFASAGDGVTLLNFTPEQMAQADDERELWTEYVIEAGTYPGQAETVTTIAQPNFLATQASLPEENVYLITKTIYENLAFLQAIHPATSVMSIEKAIAGLPLPLHPGAIRYYEEVGVTIPDRLRPQG